MQDLDMFFILNKYFKYKKKKINLDKLMSYKK